VTATMTGTGRSAPVAAGALSHTKANTLTFRIVNPPTARLDSCCLIVGTTGSTTPPAVYSDLANPHAMNFDACDTVSVDQRTTTYITGVISLGSSQLSALVAGQRGWLCYVGSTDLSGLIAGTVLDATVDLGLVA